MVSHSQPEIQRWQNPGGWGARHVNDTAPFTLWDEQTRRFRPPSKQEMSWIIAKFGNGNMHFSGWLTCIETASPPRPIPLTLGTMPVMFSRPGEMFEQPLPLSGYSNPRVPDPCSTLRWPDKTHPTKRQKVAVLRAIAPLAHVRAALFLPHWTIFELETGDGRSYERFSLPGVVAGRTALYHHEDLPFLSPTRSPTHSNLLDPSQVLAASTTLQDNPDCIRHAVLTPPTRLLESSEIIQGAWSEVDGTSSGLSMMSIGTQMLAPACPIGHPEIEFANWDTRSVHFMFGNVDNVLLDGIYGAPIVDIHTGGVSGFFQQSSGPFALSAVLDNLIAEGWEVV